MPDTLATYVHRIDPFAIQFTESFGLRWYGLSYIAGFICAYLLVRWLTARGKTQLRIKHPPDADHPVAVVADLVVVVALGTVIGGRLGYVVFYDPPLLWGFTAKFPFWDVLALQKGGMASHGGIIGIVAACILYARRTGVWSLHLLDLCAATGGIGIFFGRIANFVNGELIGRPAGPGAAWTVKFPHDMHDWVRHHAADKLIALGDVVEKMGYREAGVTPGQWQAIAADPARSDEAFAVIDRIIMYTSQDGTPAADAVAAMLEPMLVARYPSQIYQALGEGLGLWLILMIVWAAPRKPGVVGSWFLIGYAIFRILGEQFRMPDAHIANMEFAHLGVTRGQLLSFAMLSAGLVCLIVFARRPGPKLGGWASKPTEIGDDQRQTG
jgi:phosphatidylglycerol:prolipoprotein diacylglycerol transferase